MERKTTTKLDGTKAAVKAAETKAVEKAAETKAAVKEVETKAAEKAAEVKTTVKAAEEKAAAKVDEVKAVVKETTAEKKTRAVKTTKKPVKEDLKPEVFIQYQGQEAIVNDAIEKAKGEFVADGHRVSSIKSLQIYLKPEENAAYYVINQKFAGRVDLF